MTDDPRSRAVRRALQLAPVSLRAIARQADIPDSTLSRIKTRQLGASQAVAEAVAGVLDSWGGDMRDLAAEIRRASRGE